MIAENETTTEQLRLNTVKQYQILDTAPEECFSSITRLAAIVFDVPVVFISIIDEDRIWFKSAQGVSVKEMPRSAGLCGETIARKTALIIEDATEDELARNNPIVTGSMALRFYAALPLIVSNGQPLGTICIADTRPRKFSGKDRDALTEMAALAVQQLETHLHKALQASHKDILAHLSHELKNPLSLVLGYTDILRSTSSDDPSYGKYCDVILGAGNRMQALVAEALSIVSDYAAGFSINKTRLSLTPLLAAIVSRFLLPAREKFQQLKVDIQADVCIDADPVKMNEIIENLLSNAIKYTPLHKEICLIVKEIPGKMVTIIIKDQGPGFTSFDFTRLFQPFTRLSAKPTGNESSTGMGLYIVEKLVKAHGGIITIVNAEEGGAECRLELSAVPCNGSSQF
ncbi:MAG: GAF domain-containing sensor histidine kinase [Ferruginibacter sp.]